MCHCEIHLESIVRTYRVNDEADERHADAEDHNVADVREKLLASHAKPCVEHNWRENGLEENLGLEPVSQNPHRVVTIDGIEDDAPNDPDDNCQASLVPDSRMVLLENCRADVVEHQEAKERDHEVYTRCVRNRFLPHCAQQFAQNVVLTFLH
jgi:hypothetical protein